MNARSDYELVAVFVSQQCYDLLTDIANIPGAIEISRAACNSFRYMHDRLELTKRKRSYIHISALGERKKSRNHAADASRKHGDDSHQSTDRVIQPPFSPEILEGRGTTTTTVFWRDKTQVTRRTKE